MCYDRKVTQDREVELMVRWLGVSEAAIVKECKDEFGPYITYTWLKQLYEEHFTLATILAVPQTMEELEERNRRR